MGRYSAPTVRLAPTAMEAIEAPSEPRSANNSAAALIFRSRVERAPSRRVGRCVVRFLFKGVTSAVPTAELLPRRRLWFYQHLCEI
jgi:hypothetical protein